ncbi:MAG: FG-GAP-like repeat-containing protein [bacterium]
MTPDTASAARREASCVWREAARVMRMLRRARPLLPLIVCYLLLAPGCTRRAPVPQAWVWPGADSRNTLCFGQRGTRPGRLEFRRVWDAEYFGDEPQFCGPVGDARGPLLALADLDRDGRLEILPAGPHHDLELVLWSTGIEMPAGREPAGLHRRGRIVLGAEDGAHVLPLPGPVAANDEPAWLVALDGRPRFVGFFDPPDPARAVRHYALAVSDTAGRAVWSAPLGPMPMLWAVTDLDADGSDDLLVGTYGEEHGLRLDGTTDSESTYCIAFGADGRRLWQTAFGGSRFLGCRAAVADLDADGRLEVAVAIYTWHDGFGGLCVLDAATGRIRARIAGPDGVAASHVSLGIADLDADGRAEVIATTAGPQSWLCVYRFGADSLTLTARRLLGASAGSTDRYYGVLHAIGDLDGDGRLELVASGARRTPVCRDPVFYPSRVDSSRITVLDRQLEPVADLPLPGRCRSLALADLLPGGNIEILVRTDRLTLYSADRSPRGASR